jgi:prepilin-type N-terminal cleavage/methylation domain-containing protein
MKTQLLSKNNEDGFTLIEVLVVIIMIGILSAIAAPSWYSFVIRQRLNKSQDKALNVVRDAQVNAKRDKIGWQTCFKDDGTKVSFSVQPIPADGTCQNTNWESLIGADSSAIKLTQATYQVRFNYDGTVIKNATATVPFPIKINLEPRKPSGNMKACISVESLLGSIITNKDSKCN